MQEKDIAEKEFVSHNDVFADIVNGFLFHGRQVAVSDQAQRASGRAGGMAAVRGVAPSKSELSADAISSSEIVCVPC